MFCPNCGANVRDGNNFCPECGKPLGKASEPTPAPAPAPESAPTPEPTPAGTPVSAPAAAPASVGATAQNKPPKKTGLIIAIVACVVVALGILVGVVSCSSCSSDSPKTTAATSSSAAPGADNATKSNSSVATQSSGAANSSSKPSGLSESDCFDGDIPTLYGLVNMTGDQLYTALTDRGYEYSPSSNRMELGTPTSGGAEIRWTDGERPYSATAIPKIPSLGSEKKALMIAIRQGGTIESVVRDSNLDFSEKRFTTDGMLFWGITKDINGKSILVMGLLSDGSLYFAMYNEAFAASGQLDEWLEGGSVNSIDGFWKKYMAENPTGWKN